MAKGARWGKKRDRNEKSMMEGLDMMLWTWQRYKAQNLDPVK